MATPTPKPTPRATTMSSPTPDPYGGFQGGQTAVIAGDPVAKDIYGSTDIQRKQLAIKLKNAGYNVPITGKKSTSIALADAYIRASQENATENSRLGITRTVEQFLTDRVPEVEGTKQQSLPQSYVSSETQAKAEINKVFKDLLVREATDKEIKAITSILNDAQKKNPSKYIDGVTYGGLNKEQFLIDLITSGSYAAKPKASPSILKNLAKEVAEVKATAEAKKVGLEEGAATVNKNSILKTAQANGIPLSEDQVNTYLSQLKEGQNINTILQNIRENASLGMPEKVAKLLSAGTDLDTVYAPYKTILAKTLEINPSSITLDDPTLRMAIGPDKEMSLYEYQRALRKDNRWQYTDQAKQEASDVARTVLRDFGFMG